MSQYTLYASPFTSSFAVHCVLRQQGLPTEVQWVQRGPRRQISGASYQEVNPKGKVPALRLPSGELLTEIVGVLHYLQTQVGFEDARQTRRHLEWLSLVCSELHQAVLGPAFDPGSPPVAVADVRERLLPTILEPLAARLTQEATLLGTEHPTAADAYLCWALMLVRNKWPDFQLDPALFAYWGRMARVSYIAQTVAAERDALVSAAGLAST
jgi:glutathione S-transferase